MTKEDVKVICEYLKKRYDELETERKVREEEYKLRQKYCNHIWGPVLGLGVAVDIVLAEYVVQEKIITKGIKNDTRRKRTVIE